ncbi:MAG: DUF2309 domain-containing protein, partial [Ectothiorhodospiraceae bacterium]
LGLADQRFEDAAQRMARTAGAHMTMPTSFYLDAIDDGHIDQPDLAAAIADAPAGDGVPRSVKPLVDAAAGIAEPAPRPLPTVADLAGEYAGRDWAAFVTDRVSAFAAEHFDEGQASWASPTRDEPVYSAWRQLALTDRTPAVAGLRGFRDAVAALPGKAEDMLVTGLERLGIDPAAAELYFHRLLMSVGGWAAYARYKVWQSELQGRDDRTLTELLAVRLAWDTALLHVLQGLDGFSESWSEACREYRATDRGHAGLSVNCLLQSAYERAWQRQLIDRFDSAGETPARPARKAVQAAFCIDIRSEVYRRALESVTPEVETLGFAGFFGFPIEYVPLGHEDGGAQCPVLLNPAFRVRETVRGASAEEEAGILGLRILRRRAGRAWKSFKLAAVSSFAFVETAGLGYLGKLATDGLGLSRTVPHPAADGLDTPVQQRLAPDIEPRTGNGLGTEARLDTAEAALRAMSLTGDFARLVVLAGHGSTTVNNPHATGLDCGACGGHTGEANARVAAAVLNDPNVREALRERGIRIPEDTVFLAALHDTTTDEMRLFDTDGIPQSHAADVEKLQTWLHAAGRIARAERAAGLGIDDRDAVDDRVFDRSNDWSQVRPEWGLAGCAAFVAAPRDRTAGLDLGGRAFLHNYDWRLDEDYRTLELIMTAPMVVASWISLQYYGSAVDNDVFGSGNKVLHNVVGTLGVLEGHGGDLRTGLPWQSVHDGEKLVHEPLRLNVVIEAPLEAMNAVIGRHETVRNLVDNGWLHLFAMDDSGCIAHRYTGGLQWQSTQTNALSMTA